jgi:hypothetical protein
MGQRQLENTKFPFSGTVWKDKNQNQTIDTICGETNIHLLFLSCPYLSHEIGARIFAYR